MNKMQATIRKTTHYPETVLCQTGGVSDFHSLRPDFSEEAVCYGVAPLDAPEALPRGGSYVRTYDLPSGLTTWETGFVMSAGWRSRR